MQGNICTQICSYLNDTFIQALESFQQLVHNSTSEISKNNYIDVYLGNDKLLQVKTASSLSPGFNKNIAVELTILRVLWNQSYTFILTAEKIPFMNNNEIFCIIIQTTEFQAPFFQYWKKQLSVMSLLFIKQPYIQTELTNGLHDLQIIRVVVENTEIRHSSRNKCDIGEVKKTGNQFFNKGDYINAMICYQYCLSNCQNNLDINVKKTRAMLYNNSAATMYKLNLYDASLKYANITIKLDRQYYKPYVWKIHCLLEKKVFWQIPNLLVILQSKVKDVQDFAKINAKYSVYMANSLGMYNWKSISLIRKNQYVISDYFSKSISLRINQGRSIYYALQNIKKNTVLIINKPLVYDKKGGLNKSTLCERILKSFMFQKAFSKIMIDIYGESSNYQTFKMEDKLLQKKQRTRIFDKCLVKPKDIFCNEHDALGIWSHLYKFNHSCAPNCTFIHFDSIMIISTCAKINKGETFTIDKASDIQPLKRKDYLMQKNKIFCKCSVCECKSWPDLLNIEQVYKFVESATSTITKKQIFWELLNNNPVVNQQKLLDQLLKLVIKEVNWCDVYHAFQYMRTNHGKNSLNLKDVVITGFRQLLKIPTHLALQIMNNIK